MTPDEPTRLDEEDPFAGIGKGDGSYRKRKMSAAEIARKALAAVLCLPAGAAVVGGVVAAMYTGDSDYVLKGGALGAGIFGAAGLIYDGRWLTRRKSE